MSEWIISSSVLIVMVIALRYVLRGKINLRLQYALWLVVLVRLLMPVSLADSSFSVAGLLQTNHSYELSDIYLWFGESSANEGSESTCLPDGEGNGEQSGLPGEDQNGVQNDQIGGEHSGNQSGNTDTPVNPEPDMTPDKEPAVEEPNYPLIGGVSIAPSTEKLETSGKGHISLSGILTAIWCVGMAVVAVVLLVSNLRFGLTLRKTRWLYAKQEGELPIYESDVIETPCLFGLIRPAIYVTEEVIEDPKMMHHVVAHETTHHAHRDHIWAALRCLCLVLHWYNPLVWWAAALSRRDAELACDEGAIERIGEAVRAEYGRTLIGLTCQGRSHLLSTATTMTGSVKGIKERIMLIANRPKMARYTVMILIVLVVGLIGCTYCGKKETDTRAGQVGGNIEGEEPVSESADEGTEESVEDSSEEVSAEESSEELTKESTTEEPSTAEPATQEPTEELTTEEPTTEEPTTEEPATEESTEPVIEPGNLHTEETVNASGEIVEQIELGKTILVDLDGDGEQEKLTVAKSYPSTAYYSESVHLQIDDLYCNGDDFDAVMGYTRHFDDNGFYLVDLDTSDKWVEIGIRMGDGAFLATKMRFLRYQDGELFFVGEIDGASLSASLENDMDILIPGDGTVSALVPHEHVRARSIVKNWELKDSTEFQAVLEEIVPEYYELIPGELFNGVITIKQDMQFFAQKEADMNNLITLPAGTTVDMPRAYSEGGWIEVVYEDGAKTVWLKVEEDLLLPINIDLWDSKLWEYIVGMVPMAG